MLLKAADIRGPVYFSAGINPNNTLATSERTAVNPSARESNEISLRRGRLAGPMASNTRKPVYASPTPSVPPRRPSTTLSTRRPRTIRPRLAPSAARTDSSLCRTSARTRSRFATLAQAMSITRPMVAMTTHSTSDTLPTTSCLSGRRSGAIFQVS
jgi:hypothetical protein